MNPWAKWRGNEQLTGIVGRQLHGHMLPECGGSGTDVDSDVDHRALRHPHELGLRELAALEVKAAKHTPARNRFISLHEFNAWSHILAEFSQFHCLHEIAAGVGEAVRFDYVNPLYRSFQIIHCLKAVKKLPVKNLLIRCKSNTFVANKEKLKRRTS